MIRTNHAPRIIPRARNLNTNRTQGETYNLAPAVLAPDAGLTGGQDGLLFLLVAPQAHHLHWWPGPDLAFHATGSGLHGLPDLTVLAVQVQVPVVNPGMPVHTGAPADEPAEESGATVEPDVSWFNPDERLA